METSRKRQKSAQVQVMRTAKVIVPMELVVPPRLELPPMPGDLPDPHEFVGNGIASKRGHARAHHRIVIRRPETRYKVARAIVPVSRRHFEPFVTSWTVDNKWAQLVHHFNPSVKLDWWMNKRMRDWKHAHRDDRDDSRAESLRALDFRDPRYSTFVGGALMASDPAVTADSAIAAFNMGVKAWER